MEEIQNHLLTAIAAISLPELIAVLGGIIYIYFAANGKIWCWPAALVSVSIYIYLCLDAKLYAETLLQFYYWIMAIYGWWSWSGKNGRTSLPVKELQLKQHFWIIVGGMLITIVVANMLLVFTDAALPYIDSFTTVFSLITTIMVARKILSNWLYWIVIDSVGVYLYASRELYLTAVLFMAYVVIVIFGYIKWRRIYQEQSV